MIAALKAAVDEVPMIVEGRSATPQTVKFPNFGNLRDKFYCISLFRTSKIQGESAAVEWRL